MMDYSDRLFAPRGKTQAVIECRNDRVIFSKASKHIFSHLNNSRLTESRSEKDFNEKAVPVLSMIINEINMDKTLRIKQARNELLQGLLDNIKRNKKDVEVFVLDMKPDEITENKPKQIQASGDLSDKIGFYREQILKMAENVTETNHLAQILLKTHLPVTMWGAKEVQKVISKISSDHQYYNKESFDNSVEKSKNATEFLDALIQKKSSTKKNILDDVLKSVISNFFEVKRNITAMTQDLYHLFDIDKVFKKATGYPSTWFFDSSIFYDFGYNFENLVKNMIRCARLETNVIEPLFVWKVKMTGDEKCQTI